MSEACPWDPERLELAASSSTRMRAILDLLLKQGQRTLTIMQATEDDALVNEWRRAAHGLAGSALNLGMERLAHFCREDAASTATAAQRYALREGIRAELQRISTYKLTLEH